MYVDASEDEPPYFSEEIVNARLGRLMTWCAIPQCSALTSMEQRGIKLDVEWAENLRDEFTQVIPQLQNDLVEPYPELDRTGMSFAPTATWFRAWADAAVEHGDLHIAALTKTGRPQWGKGVLTRQARGGSEVAEKLLNLRGASKRLEYLTSWLATRAPDDRIYANYNQGSVVTGRLSSCVSPDTLIEMPRDMTKYPDGVPLREVKAGDWVYSFDVNMELTLRQVEWVGPTKTDKTVIVTFENSEGEQRTLTCTPDHLVRLYNGDWRHAAYLMKNANGYSEGSTASTRVLSMVRRGWKEPSGNDRYLQFFPHSNSRHTSPSVSPGSRNGSTAGGKNQEHRWVMGRVLGRKLSTKWDVNHRDGNKVNNHPSNLEYLPASEHRSNTHRDGTWGKAQPGSTSYIGPSDFRAVSVEPGPTIEVWDMTVPEDHQFIANGIVVHNSGPNMQQITHSLKPAFVPDPGFVIIDADFSQIELRIAAFISRCEPMIQAYRDGKDLHRMMAAQIINHQRRAEWVRIWGETALDEGSLILPEDVGDVERQAGKAANFGLLYGMGAFGFREYAETVYGVSFTLEEAHIVHAAFFDLWEGLRKWHIDTGTRASRDEQVVSPIGRIRRLPEINSADDKAASGAYRQAINAPVQGFASDMMQIAAAAVGGYMPRVPGIKGAQLLGTVHDSIFLQAPEDQWERVARQTQQYMVELVPRILKKMDCDFDVPLEAGVKVGTRYGLADVGAF